MDISSYPATSLLEPRAQDPISTCWVINKIMSTSQKYGKPRNDIMLPRLQQDYKSNDLREEIPHSFDN